MGSLMLMGNHGLYRNGATYSSINLSVPILDQISTSPSSAYSLRKLRTGYTGFAVRVRRSSDNSEQNIGFIGNNFDIASLTSFVGANTGFVTTLYDQSGSGINLTQATALNQPVIVSAGVFQNGVTFPDLTHLAANGNAWNPQAGSFSTSFVHQFVSGNFRVLMAKDGFGSFEYRITPANQFQQFINGTSVSTTRVLTNGNYINSSIRNVGASSIQIFTNGIADGTQAFNSGTLLNNLVLLGGRGTQLSYTGTIREVILFQNVFDRTIVERNQGAFYGITLN